MEKKKILKCIITIALIILILGFIYGKYLFNDGIIEIPHNSELIKNNAKYLKNNFLTDELIDYRLNYLRNGFTVFNKLSFFEKIFKHNYKLFNKSELDDIFNE